VFSVLVKDLDAVVHRISNNNVIVHAQAEAVWRIELTIPLTLLAELAPVQYTCTQHCTNI
jgi:hypothetical protein